MPGIDPTIALGVKVPDQMTQLSSLLGAANQAQTYQSNNITLQERQRASQYLSNPSNYMDKDGNMDFRAAVNGVMSVAPTTGMQYVHAIMDAQKQHTEATSALNSLSDQDRTRVANVLSTLKPDAAPDVIHGTLNALDTEYKGRLTPLLSVTKQGYDNASKQGPQAVAQFFDTATRGVLPQDTQQTMDSPSMSFVGTDQGTQPFNTKVGVPGTPVGPVGQPLAPPNQVGTTPTGRAGVINPAKGTYTDLQGQGGGQAAPPVNFPVGESKETWSDLQGQRTAAQQSANGAPVLHDINQTIVREANKGLNTGTLGQLTQKVASATGFNLAGESSTGYNLLGKMLERSALTAAQSMGPHTNAGLEAAVRANGSLEYTPSAIKKIAYLNDALVSGSELYRDGLEKAIGTSPDNVFAKRQFDAQWSKAATPQVLRLKNAVDNHNPEEVQAILGEVGGKGSSGAKKLHDQLTQLLKLSGQ